MDVNALAEVIHNARWPEDRVLSITPFADEDEQGKAYCIRIAKAVLAALNPPPAWDAPHNRHYEPVETRAAEIYASYPYTGPGEKPGWVPHGNSEMQDRARAEARRDLRNPS